MDKNPKGGYDTIRRRLRKGLDPKTGNLLDGVPRPICYSDGGGNRHFESYFWAKPAGASEAAVPANSGEHVAIQVVDEEAPAAATATVPSGSFEALLATCGLTAGTRRISTKSTPVEARDVEQGEAAGEPDLQTRVTPAQRVLGQLAALVPNDSCKRRRFRF